MSEPTYGELYDRSAVSLARAVTAPVEMDDIHDVLVHARDLDVVRRAIYRHAELAIDPLGGSGPRPHRSSAPVELADALRPAWLPEAGLGALGEAARPAWREVARYLGAAADLLATHVGPLGRALTPDVGWLMHPDAGAQLARGAAQLADTLGAFALHLGECTGRRQWPRGVDVDPAMACVVLWFRNGGSVRSAAHGTLHELAVVARQDVLTGLRPAPLMRREPVTDLAGATRAFDRLRRFSYAQSAGDVRADAASLRGFASLGYTVTGQGLVVYRALMERPKALGFAMDPARLAQVVGALRDANACWGRLHAALAEVHDAGGAPSGWRGDVSGVREQLARITQADDHGFRPPAQILPNRTVAESVTAVVESLSAGLGQIAVDQAAAAKRLHHCGQLHVRTRWLEDVDIPRPYARMPTSYFEPIAVAYDAVLMASREVTGRFRDGRVAAARAMAELRRTRDGLIPLEPAGAPLVPVAPAVTLDRGWAR